MDDLQQNAPFLAAQASDPDWGLAIGKVIAALGEAGPDHSLGFIYVTPHFAEKLMDAEILLRQSTGVAHWVGTIGYGTIGTTPDGAFEEVFGAPGLSVLICPFEDSAFRIFSGLQAESDRIVDTHAEWLGTTLAPAVVAHGDPANGLLGSLLEDVVQETDGFLIGGLSAIQGPGSQIADGPDGQGLSGALLALDQLPLQTALSQGCSPIGPVRTVTATDEHIILEIDGRPALDVFKEDIGEILARDLNRCSGYIFAALPVGESDQGDYTVRNIIALDPHSKAIAIAATLSPGHSIMFCRRDPTTAVMDMRRMLDDLRNRLDGRTPRGGIYVSCAARGPNQFSDPARETQLIAECLGTFPISGFFANGEFHRDRIYAYTGILTVFL